VRGYLSLAHGVSDVDLIVDGTRKFFIAHQQELQADAGEV
jgi:hypothetical protein